MPDFDEMLFTAHHMARFSEKPEQAAYWMGVEEGLRAGHYGEKWQARGWGEVPDTEPDPCRRARGMGYRIGERMARGEAIDPTATAARL